MQAARTIAANDGATAPAWLRAASQGSQPLRHDLRSALIVWPTARSSAGYVANGYQGSRRVNVIAFGASLGITLGLLLLLVWASPTFVAQKSDTAGLTVIALAPIVSGIPEKRKHRAESITASLQPAIGPRIPSVAPSRNIANGQIGSVAQDGRPSEPEAVKPPPSTSTVEQILHKPIPSPDIKERQGRYAMLLSRHLADHKLYPRHLRDQGLEGRGLVRFKLNADGSIASLAISKSTGFSELDALILKIFRRAAPFPVPEWSRDLVSTSFTLPVDFTITE